jgi:hypothetical protein
MSSTLVVATLLLLLLSLLLSLNGQVRGPTALFRASP